MPKTAPGVYADKHGSWYYKLEVGQDPLTGKRIQFTRRGFATATEATNARRDHLGKIRSGAVRATGPSSMTVAELISPSIFWRCISTGSTRTAIGPRRRATTTATTRTSMCFRTSASGKYGR